jgi:hypothetical protein
MKMRERMLAMVRAMMPTEEIRLATAWVPDATTAVRVLEYRHPGNLKSHVLVNSTSCPCCRTAFLVCVPGGWGVECPSCGRSLLYPRRTETGALQAYDSGRLLDPPSRTDTGI